MRPMPTLALSIAILGGCGRHPTRHADRREPQGPQILAALAALPDGGLRVGDLRSGTITDVLGTGGVRLRSPKEVAKLHVRTGGQRGLLGLAVDNREQTFAAYVRTDGRLVVARVAPGPQQLVWLGPQSTDLADGGHLTFDPTGRLLIGIGDLQNPPAVSDPATPNGKLLSLDPGGPADQRPRVLSRGWNNPYAFTATPGGRLLVGDNAPGRRPERIADGSDSGGAPRAVTDLTEHIAPSGLAALNDREIVVCGVRSGRLDRFRLSRSGRWRLAGRISPCRYGVARLAGGRLAISGDDGIKVLRP